MSRGSQPPSLTANRLCDLRGEHPRDMEKKVFTRGSLPKPNRSVQARSHVGGQSNRREECRREKNEGSVWERRDDTADRS
jgi:hypothetical protein